MRQMQLVNGNPYHVGRREAGNDGCPQMEAHHKELVSMTSELKYLDTPPGYDYSSDVRFTGTRLYCNMMQHGSFVDRQGSRGVAGADVTSVLWGACKNM